MRRPRWRKPLSKQRNLHRKSYFRLFQHMIFMMLFTEKFRKNFLMRTTYGIIIPYFKYILGWDQFISMSLRLRLFWRILRNWNRRMPDCSLFKRRRVPRSYWWLQMSVPSGVLWKTVPGNPSFLFPFFLVLFNPLDTGQIINFTRTRPFDRNLWEWL